MASISKVAICNMALDHVGADATIESLDEDSPAAKACKRWYDWSRIQTLEDHNWTFARKRKALAVLETEPYDDWGYAYEYPSDCVKARLIINPLGYQADPIPFDVKSKDDGSALHVLTDQEDASLEYTFNMSNPAMFSSEFIDALSFRIASRIAFTLTGNRALAGDMAALYAQKLQQASGSNAGEGTPRREREAESIRARE